MNFMAMKRCKLAGNSYVRGDIVPASILSPYEARKLLKQRMIIEVEDTEDITVPILDGEPIIVSVDELCDVLYSLQKKSDDAINDINSMEDVKMLALFRELESRKGVLSAIEKQILSVTSEEEGEA